jgi:hypothetical protein
MTQEKKEAAVNEEYQKAGNLKDQISEMEKTLLSVGELNEKLRSEGS